jgi:predicted ester cyclase
MSHRTVGERNAQVVREFTEAINARDWDALDRMVAPGFVRHSYAAPGVASREGLKGYLRREFEIFPDALETIEDLLAEGDKVAVRHRFRGTQLGALGPYPPSGRVMTGDTLAIYRLKGGLIVEAWVEWDNLHGLRQLGHYESGDRKPGGGKHE